MGLYRIRAVRTVGRVSNERRGEAHTQSGLKFAVLNLLRLIGTPANDSEELVRQVEATLLKEWVFSTVVNDTQLFVTYQNVEETTP